MKLLKLIFYPLVPVYLLVISLRNLFFDRNILKSKNVNAKIISVGNISVGGSGKTPLVIYIADLLKSSGERVAVLSRGYGRKSKGYKLVSDGENIFTEVQESGDEIYQTVLECKVPAAVCENRVYGAKQLIKDTNVNIIVLDDGFQHRWINRDIDIVIIEQRFIRENNFFTHNLLPTGNLREPFSALQRSDAIVVNRKFSEEEEIPDEIWKYVHGKEIFTAHYKAISFVDIVKKDEYKLEEFEGQKSLVVSGIANPFSFLNALSQTSVDVSNKLIFRDHKNYSQKEVQRIRKSFYATNSHSVVTTEKDAVKLIKFSKDFDDIDIFFLKIKLVIDDGESFGKYLLSNN
ncbi:MAG: tetraacyldisaccharide 4'-kinase [Ignavibacteria bacterium]|nr:tetraacyldisaccharide 4'-kinase [Ignavibacteria bacterium]